MIDTLHAVSAVLADWVVETSVQVAVLAAVVWAVCALGGARLSARWRYALWALVLVRLLLPVIPSSPVSVHNVSEVVSEVAAGPHEPDTPAAHDVHGVAASGGGATVGDAASRRIRDESLSLLAPASDRREGAAVAALSQASSVPAAPGWPWRSTAVLVWLAGVALAGGWTAFREARFRRALRAAEVVVDGRVAATLDALLGEAGVRRSVTVLRTDLVDGPALTGIVRPRVLIPGRVLDGLSDAELRHVLAHEIEHLRAGDVLQNALMAGLSALHWFNPLVRVAFARLRVEREAVRDLAALRGESRETRQAYGRTLLRLLEEGARPTARPLAVSLLERRRDLRRRIEMIARDGNGGRRRWLVGALVTAGVVAVAMTGATSDPVSAQEEGRQARETSDPPVRPERPSAEDGEREAGTSDPTKMPSFVMSSSETAAVAAMLSGERIHVERRAPAPEWESDLRVKLAARITLDGGRQSLTEALAKWSEATGVHVVMHETGEAGQYDSIVVPHGEMPAAELLDLVLWQTELRYSTAGGIFQVGDPWALPVGADQRFYRIDPLLEAGLAGLPAGYGADERESFADNFPERVMEMVMTFVWDMSWEMEGVSMMPWRGLLLIEQKPDVHARIEGFLNMLLARSSPPLPRAAWRDALDVELAKPISIDFKGARLAEVADYLSGSTGVNVIVPLEEGASEAVTLKLTNLPLREALNVLARTFGMHAVPAENTVVLRHYPELVVRPYDVRGGLLELDDEGREQYDSLIEVVRRSAAPTTWEDLEGAQLIGWDGMLIARTTESTHAKVAEFLAAARRALAK